MNAFLDWLHDAAERALPVVCAFALGVAITSQAAQAEADLLRAAVRQLADQIDATRVACGAAHDHDAAAVRYAAAPAAKVQP